MKALTIVVLFAVLAFSRADIYAVIVAGSNGFYNYRHQTDACHAYHSLLQHGVKADNIILMSYNDVADSRQNPFKGSLYNKPSGKQEGVDVNKGCVIDYEGKDVTPKNYMAILTGNKSAVTGGNGRVLQSTSDDYVFLNFADHGGVGLIAFPSSYLYAKDLIDTFQTMYNKKMYKQLVYYMEACESGSMFQQLPKDINIYAVSAASPSESSWAYYCPPEDEVNGKHIGSCLGDEFSIHWMENTDASDTTSKTLQVQFEEVKAAVRQSHVMQWGDTSFTDEVIGTFVGKQSPSKIFLKKLNEYYQQQELCGIQHVAWDSRAVQLNYYLNKFTTEPSNDEHFTELQKVLTQTKKLQQAFTDFQEKYKISGIYYGSTNFDCYKHMINTLKDQCGEIPDASMAHFKYLYQYCAMYTFWQTNDFTFC